MRVTALALVAASLGFTPAAAEAVAPQHHAAQPDRLQARLTARLATVERRLASARRSGRVSAARAAGLRKRLAWVRTDSARMRRQQGFLSAGESASYNRTLDTVEAALRR